MSAPISSLARARLTFVESAGEALLAPFLVDEGGLPAFLAEIADAPKAALTVARPAVMAGPRLPDVLGQRARQRIGKRKDLRRAEPRRLTAADTRELTADFL